eukprot:jgi/Tetstr1/435802/TSEL_024691.t1
MIEVRSCSQCSASDTTETSQSSSFVSSCHLKVQPLHRRRRSSVHDNYEVLDLLGSGTTATVHRAVCRASGEEVALKFIPTGKSEDAAIVQSEHGLNERVSSLSKCRRFVVPLADSGVLEDEHSNRACLVFKLMPGGSLADLRLQHAPLSESDAKRAMFNVFSALAALHKHSVAHLDVKPGNVMLEARGDFSTARLADLGLSQDLRERNTFRTPAGTPSYFAPELVHVFVKMDGACSYGKAVDLWAAGVVLYELLAGTKPFDGTTTCRLFSQICSAPVNTNTGCWETISHNAKDLAHRCLDRDQRTRITAKQALAHPWFDDVREQLGTTTFRRKTASWIRRKLSCVKNEM